jgi:phosphoesterase RecJ-like protein
MALSSQQQFIELINRHQSILIIFGYEYTGDALGASLALETLLRHLDKRVAIACANFTPEKTYSFLPLEKIAPDLTQLQKTVIGVDLANINLDTYYHRKDDKTLKFYLVPDTGIIDPKQISVTQAQYEYDLIITINSPDLESLGSLYHKYTNFFYSTPKINIDHHTNNENYGDFNIVDITASATSEIVYNLIRDIAPECITADLATHILTGIITATNNFKDAHVHPQTLHLASLLVAQGARREEIITNLYQNHSITTLKLWGRILSRLHHTSNHGLVWSTITQNDILETDSSTSDINEVIDALLTSIPQAQVITLFYEDGHNIIAITRSLSAHDARTLTHDYLPEGTSELTKCTLKNTTLAQAQTDFIKTVEQRLTA